MSTVTLPAECVEQLRDGLIVVQPPGVVAQINEAAARLFGESSPRALINMPIHDLIRDSRAGKNGRVLLRQANGSTLAADLARFPDPSVAGREVLRLSPVRVEESPPSNSVWLAKDTAALAARVGHELANMLTPVLGSVELCRHALGGDGAGPARDAMDAVERFGNRLLLHAGNLRSLRPRTTLRRRPQDLARAIGRSLETVRHTGIGARHQIVNLAAKARTPLVDVDSDLIEQLIVNLVVNAAESMAAPGTIELELRASGPVVELTVSDNGPGIADDVLARIDDPISRLPQTHRGLGLGLYVVRRIAEQHDADFALGANSPQGVIARLSLRAVE